MNKNTFLPVIVFYFCALLCYGEKYYSLGPYLWKDKLLYVCNEKGEFSFINQKGNLVIPYFFEQEKAIERAFFMPVRYEQKMLKLFRNSIYKIVKWQKKWGVIDSDGRIVCENIYDDIWGFLDKEQGIVLKKDKYYKFVAGNLTQLFNLHDKKILYFVFKNDNDKVYILDLEGNKIAENIPLALLNLIAVKDFLGNKIARLNDKSYSYISNVGELISLSKKYYYRSAFVGENALAIIKNGKDYNIYRLDSLGNESFLLKISANGNFDGTELNYLSFVSNDNDLYSLKFYESYHLDNQLDLDKQGLILSSSLSSLPTDNFQAFYFNLDASIYVEENTRDLIFNTFPLYWKLDLKKKKYQLKNFLNNTIIFSFTPTLDYYKSQKELHNWTGLFSLSFPNMINNKLFVYDNIKKGFICINSKGKRVFDKVFDIAGQFVNEKCLVKNKGRFFIINAKGQEVLSLSSYDGSAPFFHGLSLFVYKNYLTYKEISLIDDQGNQIISFPQYKK